MHRHLLHGCYDLTMQVSKPVFKAALSRAAFSTKKAWRFVQIDKNLRFNDVNPALSRKKRNQNKDMNRMRQPVKLHKNASGFLINKE